LVSAERHRCDVHAMLAKQSPDSTDHTGAIGIFEHENHPMRPRFHWTGVDANDSWSNSKKCPADRYVFSFRSGRKFEHVGIIAGRAQPGLGDFQSQTFCECGRAYFIHFAPTGALQKAFEHGARDGGGMDCAISIPTLSCASAVEEPRCGVRTSFAIFRNGESAGNGSVSKTSSAAPAT